jgi:apolipoprotein N-acyltransferase
MSGLVFQVVAAQALAVVAVRRRSWPPAALAAALVLVPVGWGAWLVHDEAGREGGTRVAAIGWRSEPGDARSAAEIFDERIRPGVLAAAAQGARVVVTPEIGLLLGAHDRPGLFARLQDLAEDEHLRLVVGWYDLDAERNLVSVFDFDGHVSEPYRKTHLVPFVEAYPPGDGTLLESGGERGLPVIGAMICQDDNFTDLARGYGRDGVRVVAVPTHDWREVAPYHLENSRFRAVENRYTVVRAAVDGTSAIISPTGRLLASLDHFTHGDGVIVARVTIPTASLGLYSWFDWPPFAWLGIIAAALVRARRRS